MPGKTLLVLPSTAAEITTTLACTFSVRGFTHVALVGDNAEQLAKNKDDVLDAIQERGYSCQTKTFLLKDLQNASSVADTLHTSGVAQFGGLQCLVFDAAGGDDELVQVFEQVAKWATSIFEDGGNAGSPTILVLTESKSADVWDTAVQSSSIGSGIRSTVLRVDEEGSAEDVAERAWQLYKSSS